MGAADLPLVEADRLPGFQAQHQQRVIHRTDLHRVLQHADPALAVVAAHTEACTQGAHAALGGLHLEGAGGGVAGGLHHDLAAVQA
ncbi:hypothetical protein D3C79_858410 [compost metagenome]